MYLQAHQDGPKNEFSTKLAEDYQNFLSKE